MMLLDYVWACRPVLRIGVFARNPHPHHHALPAAARPVGRPLHHAIRHWAIHPVRKVVHAVGGACRWVPFLVTAGIAGVAPLGAPAEGFAPEYGVPAAAGAAFSGGGFAGPGGTEAGEASGGLGGGGGGFGGGDGGSGGGAGGSGRASAAVSARTPATATSLPLQPSASSSLLGLSPLASAPYAPLGVVSPGPALPYMFVAAAVPAVVPAAVPALLPAMPGPSVAGQLPAASQVAQKPTPIVPVPEPSTLSLLLGAALLLFALRPKILR